MAVIYDGTLPNRMVEYINLLLYDFSEAIEMHKLPDDWSQWSEHWLRDYTSMAEDCQGYPYTHKSKSYAILRRNDPIEPLFLFLKTQREKQAVLEAFPDLILNASPFRTIIRP